MNGKPALANSQDRLANLTTYRLKFARLQNGSHGQSKQELIFMTRFNDLPLHWSSFVAGMNNIDIYLEIQDSCNMYDIRYHLVSRIKLAT